MSLKTAFKAFGREITKGNNWAERHTYEDYVRFLEFATGNAKEVKKDNYQSQLNQFYETVYNCVTLNSKAFCTFPIGLYAQKNQGKYKQTKELQLKKKEYIQKALNSDQEYVEVTKHEFLDLLYYVNKHQSSIHLWQGTVTFLELTGMCFWYLPQNATGLPAEINILPTQQFKELRIATEGENKGDIIQYVFKGKDKDVTYEPDEILMFKYFNPYNQYLGLSPLVGSLVSVNRTNKMDVYEDATLDNMGRVDGVLSTEQALLPEQKEKIAEDWKQKYGGVYNAGKVAVLSNGTKYQQIALSLRDMAYPQGRKWTLQQICNAFGVPVDLLSGQSSSYQNYETALRHHGMYGVKPIQMVIQETISELLLPRWDKNLFCMFENPVKEDRELKMTEYKTSLAGNPWRTINEIRAEENLEPIDGGDMIYTAQGMPLGMTPEQVGKMAEDVINIIREKKGRSNND